MSYYKEAKAIYGARSKDPETRGKMTEGICEAGEIFFVPSGYWHSTSTPSSISSHSLIVIPSVVVNLEPSIAVTQNFVSRRELPKVLNFMKYRPQQVSGFKLRRSTITTIEGATGEAEISGGLDECDETVSGVYESFCEALARDRGDLAREALDAMDVVGGGVEERDSVAAKGLWEKVTDEETPFSFGFFDAGDDTEDF